MLVNIHRFHSIISLLADVGPFCTLGVGYVPWIMAHDQRFA